MNRENKKMSVVTTYGKQERGPFTGRRVLIAILAVLAMLVAVPTAAQAAEGLSHVDTNNTTINGQTVDFGTNGPTSLPFTRTVYFWTNTNSGGFFNSGRRHVAVDVSWTNSNYEYVSISRTTGANGNCGVNSQTGNSVRLVLNYTGTGYKACGAVFRLKAGVQDALIHGATMNFAAAPSGSGGGGCNGPASGTGNCAGWAGGSTTPGSASWTGTVTAGTYTADFRDTGNTTSLSDRDFGALGVGNASDPYTFVFRNTGTGWLTTTNNISFTGTDAGDFSHTTNCGANLPGGSNCQIAVTFTPQGAGLRSASLQVNSGTGGSISLPLTGTGIPPTFIPTIQNTAGNAPEPTYSFPDVNVGEPFFPTYVFTLRNTGNAPLNGTNIQAVTGADAGDYTRSTNCPASLDANETCTITVGFNPGSVGEKLATLEVNTTNGGSATAALDGTANAGVKQTTIQNTAGDTNLPDYTFPDTVALNSASYVFTVRNTGNVNLLAVNTQSLTGDDADQFTRSTNCGASLAPNATCTVTVNFAPNRVEAGMQAQLNIDPSNGGSSNIPLTATSLTPTPVLSIRDTGDTADLTSSAFTANIGSSQAYVFTVKNTGDSALNNVNSQTVTGANAAEFVRTSSCGASLAPGASCTTTITFNATRSGTRTATLTFNPSNPLVSPASRVVSLTGEGTGVGIQNDVTDNLTGLGSQKRWLESLSLAPGGPLQSDTIRVAFEVDVGQAQDIAGVDIVGSMTTNDTPPGSGFQDIVSLPGGEVDVQRKPGSGQALVRAEVPLQSTNLGQANSSYGFSAGSVFLVFCTGGNYASNNRRAWFRVRGSDGSTSATVGSVVRLSNQVFACPDNQGPNLGNQRILEVGGDSLPSGTNDTIAEKGESATFQFNTRARGAPLLGGDPGWIDGVNWRIRNAKTGDMFRIVNGNYTACAEPCTDDANFTQGGRFNFPDRAAGVKTLTIPGIPSRGRWIVEAAPQGTNEDDSRYFGLGTLRVNDLSGTSPTLTFGGTLGARPDTDTGYTISANIADPADPVSAFDTQGGQAQVIEWDLDGNTTNGADGEGFEFRSESDSSAQPPAEALVQAFDTTGKTPGPYTIRARVTDNGSALASENVAVSRIFEFNTTINSPAEGVTETINIEAETTQPFGAEFRATDVDSDPYKVAITPDPGNDGSLAGNLNGPIGDNTKPYSWPATYTGTDTFVFTATDDRLGTGSPATLTIRVRPNTTIDAAAPNGLNPNLPNGFLGSTTDTSASFDFSSPQNPVNEYECRRLVDGNVVEDWATCAEDIDGTKAYSNLEDGLQRFEVRAINDEDQRDGTPAFRTWRVDNTAPDTEIRVGPDTNLPNQQPRLTNDTTPSYIFRATAAERSFQEYVTYECRILFGPESGTWQACGAPSDTQGSAVVDIVGPTPDFGITDPLAEGPYTIEVRATDEVGNLGSVLVEDFVVDTSPPETALASGAEGLVNTRDLEYVLSSSEGQSTFTCQLDYAGGPNVFPMGPCPSPGAADGSRPEFTVPTDGEYVLTAIATDPATNPDPTPLEIEFEVDATEPTTTLDPNVDFGDGPTVARRTQSRKIDLTFSGNDSRQMSGFQCRLDSAVDEDWTLCQSVERFGGLSDGSHTLEIRARDEAGNFDSTPEEITWVVDRTPPVTTIDGSPDPVDNDASPSVDFSVNETATSECRLDGGSWSACSSPVALVSLNGGNPLADGPHSFNVRSTDEAANLELTLAAVTWSIDTVVPVVEFTSTPAEFVPQGSVNFGWSVKDGSPLTDAPEADSECNLDGNGFEACGRTFSIADPANGPHTLIVRATDQAGNVSVAVDYTFEVLGEPPVVPVIDNSDPVDGATTRLRTAGFAFSHEDENEGSFGGFQCRLDGGLWVACESPFQTDGLGNGPHSFEVRARDIADNLSAPASVQWDVQAGAPVTTINGGPSGLTRQNDSTATFSSDKAGTFECQIDGAAWAVCTSPLEFTDQPDGDHSLRVRAISAVDPVGVKDPTPPARFWTIDTVAPDVAIDSAPAAKTDTRSATLTFSSTDGDSGFQCKVNTGLFDACSSPLNLGSLDEGEQTVTIRAVDPAGNLSAEPAVATWIIEDPVCAPGFEGTPPNCTEIELPDGPGIKATLTEGTLSLASLGEAPLPAEQLILTGKRAENGGWGVPASGVVFKPIEQVIDAPGIGTVTVKISIQPTGPGLGTLPSGGGAATFVLPVRAKLEASLGTIPIIGPGADCFLRPILFDLAGTYDEAGKTLTVSSDAVSFPTVSPGCGSLGGTVNGLLELPRSDIALDMTFNLEDITGPQECTPPQIGTFPDCKVTVLDDVTVKSPKKLKSGKKVTIRYSVANTGTAAATNVKVCLTLKKAKKLAKGKAKRCRTIKSIAPGQRGVATFKVKTKKIKGKKKRMNFSVTASAAGGIKAPAYRGHVTVLK